MSSSSTNLGQAGDRLRELPLEYAGAVGATVLMIIGAIGPWAKVLFVSVSGIDGQRDGWIVLVLAILSLIALASVLRGAPARKVATGIAVDGLIAGGVAIYDWTDLPQGNAIATVSPGWGLYLTVFASAALVFCGLKLYASSPPAVSARPVQPANRRPTAIEQTARSNQES